MKPRALLLSLILVPAVALAKDNEGYGEKAAAYLSLMPSARAAAMGYAFGAVVPREATDASNPATLALMDAQYFSATSGSIGLGRRLTNAGYVFPCHWSSKENFFRAEEYPMTTPRSSWSGWIEPADAARYALYVGGTSFGVDGIEGQGEFGDPTGNFNDSERNFGLGLAGRPYQNVAFGFSGRFLQQALSDGKAKGIALSFGLWYGVPFLPGALDLGLGYRDFAGKLSWDVNDPELGITYSYQEKVAAKIFLASAWTSPRERLKLTADLVNTSGADARVDLGTEISLGRIFHLRGGLHEYEPTFGCGVLVGRRAFEIGVDYAFQPDLDSLSNSSWVTFTLRFLPIVSAVSSDEMETSADREKGAHRLDRLAAPAAKEPPPPAPAAVAPPPVENSSAPAAAPSPTPKPARKALVPRKPAAKPTATPPVRRTSKPTLGGSKKTKPR
jgi:hypothetical protein